MPGWPCFGGAFYAPDDKKPGSHAEGGICALNGDGHPVHLGLYRGLRCGAAFVLDNGPRTTGRMLKADSPLPTTVEPVVYRKRDRPIDMGFEAMCKLPWGIKHQSKLGGWMRIVFHEVLKAISRLNRSHPPEKLLGVVSDMGLRFIIGPAGSGKTQA